jgi:multidrug efflux pump subunit AcrA (membrane-fusion protein)
MLTFVTEHGTVAPFSCERSMVQSLPLPSRALLWVALALCAVGLSACNDARSADEKARMERDRPVLVQPVHFESSRPDRTFVAVVRPRVESDLGFRVAGKVARRAVEVGQAVAAGDVLAVLDETDFRLQHEQAEAELRAAATSLEQAAADEKRVADLKRRGWSPDAT